MEWDSLELWGKEDLVKEGGSFTIHICWKIDNFICTLTELTMKSRIAVIKKKSGVLYEGQATFHLHLAWWTYVPQLQGYTADFWCTVCFRVRRNFGTPLFSGLGWLIMKPFDMVNANTGRFGLVYDNVLQVVRYPLPIWHNFWTDFATNEKFSLIWPPCPEKRGVPKVRWTRKHTVLGQN